MDPNTEDIRAESKILTWIYNFPNFLSSGHAYPPWLPGDLISSSEAWHRFHVAKYTGIERSLPRS